MKIFVFLFGLAFFTLAGLWAFQGCSHQEPEQAAPEVAVNESGEPLGATITPRYYVAYTLSTAFGAVNVTGATWVETKAWMPVPVGTTPDRKLLMNDLIAKLTKDGTLKPDVKLTEAAKNYLLILGASASVKPDWVLDSRFLF